MLWLLKNVWLFLQALHDDIINTPLQKHYPNLTKAEVQAGVELINAQKERKITIKPADKSGAVCILDTEDYIKVINTWQKSSHCWDTKLLYIC